VYFVYVSVLVCTCLNAADIHFWFARSFGDIPGFSDPRLSPVYIPLWGLIIALTVHLFFCYRIFLVGRRRLWPLVAVIALVRHHHKRSCCARLIRVAWRFPVRIVLMGWPVEYRHTHMVIALSHCQPS
jgi:hypothetical protein